MVEVIAGPTADEQLRMCALETVGRLYEGSQREVVHVRDDAARLYRWLKDGRIHGEDVW